MIFVACDSKRCADYEINAKDLLPCDLKCTSCQEK